ncbi:MAG: hypothetical protein AAGA05_11275, partial [Pseudomonadota bacterium]
MTKDKKPDQDPEDVSSTEAKSDEVTPPPEDDARAPDEVTEAAEEATSETVEDTSTPEEIAD